MRLAYRRRLLHRVRDALERALASVRAAASMGGAGDAHGKLASVRGLCDSYLISKLRNFHLSPERWCCSRLWSASPSYVGLRDFTLLRRFGKGSYGQVFAARKEDTMVSCDLVVLACPPATRAARAPRLELRCPAAL